ncbi:uncharacterized protein SCHCODRAFT_02084736 [Schizophyllum commune H4-8]|uniref:uncharacterized protein n=1 Tax=Schizophyllum commune (strain H4-8 / FGSC 9210) TaxID=578458 RepID=UPI00215F4C61|nr:uncharacterized protein SCHCODRAFT_02084736 [Schizophyllum commune H4-8]KAI5886905.1 hypothetical protein SCHCODRAFT_02084736 [Schizophyllum commune H4-8]
MPAIPFVCVRAHPSPAPRHPPGPRKSERTHPPRRPYAPSPRRPRLNFQQRQRARLVPAWNLFGTFQRPWPATSHAGRLTVFPARAAPLVAAADAPRARTGRRDRQEVHSRAAEAPTVGHSALNPRAHHPRPRAHGSVRHALCSTREIRSCA